MFNAKLSDTNVEQLEFELAQLANAFTTVPDDPSACANAMASLYAQEWTIALQEEFNFLHDLSIYKLIPHTLVPVGHKLMPHLQA
jgi:hypothetical protein